MNCITLKTLTRSVVLRAFSALAVASCLSAVPTHAACGYLADFPPIYCVRAKIKKTSLSETCTAEVQILEFSIPRADLQNLRYGELLQKLQRDELVGKGKGLLLRIVKGTSCPKLKPGDIFTGYIQSICYDAKSILDPPESVRPSDELTLSAAGLTVDLPSGRKVELPVCK
mgnify:CR=1 FL=1